MNPFLSEFEYVVTRTAGFAPRLTAARIAATLWLLSVATAILSYMAGAACMRIVFESARGRVPPVELLFGYMAEPNHGVYFLLITPLLIYAICWFLNSAERAVGELEASGRLIVLHHAGNSADADSPIHVVARRNRSLFRIVTPFILVFAPTIMIGQQCIAYRTVAFGWVQAPFLADYSPRQTEQGESRTTLRWLEQRKRVTPIPKVRSLCNRHEGSNSPCDSITCEATVESTSGGSRGNPWYWPFLISSILHHSIIIALGVWAASKVLFFVLLVASAVPRAAAEDASGLRTGSKGSRTPRLQFNLEFRDPDTTFGLAGFLAVYRSGLVLVAISSLQFTLERFSNMAKGTDYFKGAGSGLIAAPLMLLMGLLAFILIVVGPLVLLGGFAARARSAEIRRLGAQSRNATDEEQRARILEIEQRVRKQSLFPKEDKLYLTLLATCMSLLILIPLGLEQFVQSDKVLEAVTFVTSRLPEFICSVLP